jgi:outer membrane protein insertion porin family
LCFLLLSFPLNASAQSPADLGEGKIVKAVSISGNQAVSTQLISAQIRMREGKIFSRAEARKDVKRLFALGYFSDIKVDVSPEGQGVAVTYIVTERKIVRDVLILGNKSVKESDITAVISLRRGKTYVPMSIENDITAIRDLCRQKGFSRASVSASYREIGPTEVEIVYEIAEGIKARVRYITIENNDALTDKEIRKKMSLRARALWFGTLFDDSTFERDIKSISELYADLGYIDAKVTDANAEFFNEGERVHIRISVDEGEQYFIDTVNVEGNTIFKTQRLLALTQEEPGEFYNKKRIELDAMEIQTLYADEGYILASVRPQIKIRRDEKKVSVTHGVSERDLIYVAKINVRGNIKTKDEVIRRELTILPGERFDGGNIRRSRQKLMNTQFYKDVGIGTEATGKPNYRNLEFTVAEDKTGSFNFGAGFSSNDSFIGQIQLSQSNFDLFNFPSFTGAGQKFNLSLRPGTVLSEYLLNFTEPYFLGYPFSAGFDAYSVDREYEEYDQEYIGGGIRLGKRVTEYTRIGVSYNFTEYDIFNVDEEAPQTIKDEEGERAKSAMTLSITLDTRDSYMDPTKGHKFTASVEAAGGPLGAETDFTKITSELRWFIPVTKKWTLMTRLEAGVVEEFGDSEIVPLFDRFFAGGSNSVRGYDYREVGPREDGDPIGGKTKMEGSLEISYPLIEIIKGYMFFDFGQVWAEVEDFGQDKINTSAGVGVRMNTPIGPMRLDYGYPLNPDDDQGGGQIHFTTGFSF